MEWKEVRLGDIADVQTGPFGSQLHKSDYIAEGIPCIMPTNIGPHLNLVVDGIAHVSEVDANRLSRHLTEFGDIIYARRGDIEKCAYVTTNEEKWLCGTGCLKIRCKNEVNSRFIAYLLSTAECKKWITGNAVGTTMLNLSKGILSNLPLIIPSLVDQRRIASILSSLDRKIELNNKINADLEEMAQAIFKNWLSECSDDVTIGELSLNITNYEKTDAEEVVLINSSDVTEGYFDHHNYSPNKNLKGHFKKRFQKGDILYSQVRPRNRHWAYCNFDANDYLASTQLMVIRNNPSLITSILLYQYIISDNVWKEFTLKTETRSGTFPQGNYEDLSQIRVPYNSDVEGISNQLETLYAKMFMLEKENSRLSLLRDTLLPRLMSGELEVPE